MLTTTIDHDDERMTCGGVHGHGGGWRAQWVSGCCVCVTVTRVLLLVAGWLAGWLAGVGWLVGCCKQPAAHDCLVFSGGGCWLLAGGGVTVASSCSLPLLFVLFVVCVVVVVRSGASAGWLAGVTTTTRRRFAATTDADDGC